MTATVACVALTRVDRGAHRPVSQRLVLLATVAVMASGIVLLSSTGFVGRDAFGVADLALASALAGAVIVGQRKQRAARQSPAPAWRDGSRDHALPVTTGPRGDGPGRTHRTAGEADVALPDFFIFGAPKAGTTALHAAWTNLPLPNRSGADRGQRMDTVAPRRYRHARCLHLVRALPPTSSKG